MKKRSRIKCILDTTINLSCFNVMTSSWMVSRNRHL